MRLYGIILLQFLCSNVFSTGFIDTDKIMTYQEYRNLLFPSIGYINNIFYARIGSDTLVNSIHYNKLESTPDTTNLTWNLWGLVRESSNKKIYFKPLQDKEQLLFDFSLKINDLLTVYSFSCINTVDLIAYKIDSVELNQKYYKRFYLKTTDDVFRTVWIENIGDSITGIFQSVNTCPGGISMRLLCQYHERDLVFNNSMQAAKEVKGGLTIVDVPFDCKFPAISTKVPIVINNHLSFYPNPLQDKLEININSENLYDFKIRILGINGQLKYLKLFNNSTQKIELVMKTYNRGIYILEYSANNIIERYKIIKE